MITFTQQIEIVSFLWSKFEKSANFISKEQLTRYKLFLNSSKYENQTTTNFKIIILYCILNNNPSSLSELLQIINRYKKDDIKKTVKLKSDILAKKWLLNKDKEYLIKNNNPYQKYKTNYISIFGVHDYYKNNPEEIKGRIMKKSLEKIAIFINLFEEK